MSLLKLSDPIDCCCALNDCYMTGPVYLFPLAPGRLRCQGWLRSVLLIETRFPMSKEKDEPRAVGAEGKSERVEQQIPRREGEPESKPHPERVDLADRLRQVLEVRILN